jgi:hypothetical protein
MFLTDEIVSTDIFDDGRMSGSFYEENSLDRSNGQSFISDSVVLTRT